MPADLKDQIQLLMERGIRPVTATDIARREGADAASFLPGRPVNRRRRRLMTAGLAGLTAAACAAVLTATLLSPAGTPRTGGRPAARHPAPAIETAAYVRHLASASRIALAQSGRAVVTTRQTSDGAAQQSSRDLITFDGRNWNDSLREVLTGPGSRPAGIQTAVNRVVDGQAYDYFNAIDGTRWYHVTGPDAVASLSIPDPRDLLAELSPTARFAATGRAVLDGVAVTKLTATDPARLPALSSSRLWPAGSITSLTLWVDASGVVRRLAASSTQLVHGVVASAFAWKRSLLHRVFLRVERLVRQMGRGKALRVLRNSPLGRKAARLHLLAPQLIRVDNRVMVTFSGIGQPQVIRVPAGAITIRSVG